MQLRQIRRREQEMIAVLAVQEEQQALSMKNWNHILNQNYIQQNCTLFRYDPLCKFGQKRCNDFWVIKDQMCNMFLLTPSTSEKVFNSSSLVVQSLVCPVLVTDVKDVGYGWSSTGASIHVSDWWGKSQKNCNFFGAICTQYHNIGLCARSAPKILTCCIFICILMLNLMVL